MCGGDLSLSECAVKDKLINTKEYGTSMGASIGASAERLVWRGLSSVTLVSSAICRWTIIY